MFKSILLFLALTFVLSVSAFSQSVFAPTLVVKNRIHAYHSVADTASFSTTANRLAIYVKGIDSLSMVDCFIAPIGSSTPTVDTVTSASLFAWAKKDSIIVYRKWGGTSGAKIGYIRVKPLGINGQ